MTNDRSRGPVLRQNRVRLARLLEAGAAHWPPEEAAVPRNPGENRANLHPTYYEDLMEFWGTDTPLARRFIFGEWVAFALERPFRREWLQYWPDNEREVPDATEAIGKSWFDVRIGVDQAASLKDMACRSAVVVVGQVRLPGPFLGCLFVLHGRGSWRTTSTCS